MTVEGLRAGLEEIIAELEKSGFDTIDAATIEKMDKFAIISGELDMKEGKRLIQNLSETMKAIQEGKSAASSGSLRLTALDFYLQNTLVSGVVEDL